jgi:hypothetical protein
MATLVLGGDARLQLHAEGEGAAFRGRAHVVLPDRSCSCQFGSR